MKKYISTSSLNSATPGPAAICLLGIKHCGKTVLARYLAEHNGFNTCDLDDVLLSLYRQKRPESNTNSVRDIYKSEGSAVFQEYELLAVQHALASNKSAQPIVIACGGGICDNPPALKKLRSMSVFVYIATPRSIIWQRLLRKGLPAFLEKETKPHQAFKQTWKRRTKLYKNIADIRINGRKDAAKKAQELLQKLPS